MTGEIPLDEETTDQRNKEETEPFETIPLMDSRDLEEQMRLIQLLANSTEPLDDEEASGDDYDYATANTMDWLIGNYDVMIRIFMTRLTEGSIGIWFE